MKLRFWGTRSGIATPGIGTSELGGNTSCIEVFLEDGQSLLLNSGTGIIEYGARGITSERQFHILLTGLSWDLIQGFPFFAPIHRPDARIALHSPLPVPVVQEAFLGLFDGSYSPLRNMANLNAQISFHPVGAEGSSILGAQVFCRPTAYPVAAYACKVCTSTLTLACVLKHERRREPAPEGMLEFLRGTDLLIHDGQFTREEYGSREGWGHSTIDEAIDVALEVGARALFIVSHDPAHDDNLLRVYLHRRVRERGLNREGTLWVELAAEHRLWELTIAHFDGSEVSSNSWLRSTSLPPLRARQGRG